MPEDEQIRTQVRDRIRERILERLAPKLSLDEEVARNPFGAFKEPTPATFFENLGSGLQESALQAIDIPGLPFGVGDYLHNQAEQSRLRYQGEGVGGFLGNVVGGLAGIVNPKNIGENVLLAELGGTVGSTLTRKAAAPIISRIEHLAGKEVADVTSGALARIAPNATTGALFPGVEQAKQEDFTKDPLGATGRVLSAAGIGAAGSTLGGELFHSTTKAATFPRQRYIPDVVLPYEKHALGNVEPYIAAYRESLRRGGQRFAVNEQGQSIGWLKLPASKAAGYNAPASDLAQQPRTQDRIAQVQRRTADKLLALQDAKGFTIEDKIRVAVRLDAENVTKIATLQGKDTDSPSGARTHLAKAAEVQKLQPEVIVPLEGLVDQITKKFPNETQTGTMDRLIEEADSQQLAPELVGFLRGVREKMASDETFLPYGERVRQSQTALRGVVEGITKVGPEAVAAVKQGIDSLPEHLRKSFTESKEYAALLDPALNTRLSTDLVDFAKSVQLQQERFLRSSTTSDLKGDTANLGRNPQRDAVLARLRGAKPTPLPPALSPPEAATGRERAPGGALAAKVLTAKEAKALPVDKTHPWWNLKSPDFVNEGLIREGKNPSRILNEEDANRPKTVEQLAKDPLTLYYERIGQIDLADRIRRGDLSPNEYKIGLAEAKANPVPKLRAAVKYKGEVYATEGQHVDALIEVLKQRTGATTEQAQALLASDEKTLRHGAKPFFQVKAGEELSPAARRSLALTERYKLAGELTKLSDSANGFVDEAGKFYSRKAAAKLIDPKAVAGEAATSLDTRTLAKQATAKAVIPAPAEKPLPPIITTDPKTGYEVIDQAALAKLSAKLSLEDLQVLRDDIRSLVRRGQIEKGLYIKALKFDGKQDVKDVVREVKRLPKRSDEGDTRKLVAGLIADPATFDAQLEQQVRGDRTAAFYRINHGDLVDPMSRHLRNEANTSRFANGVVKDTLGLDTTSIKGQVKLAHYLGEELPSGLTRDQAMRAYAWSTDSGRQTELTRYGVERGGKVVKAEDAIAGLSTKDKAYVDQMKAHFQNNPVHTKAFNNVLLLLGRAVRTVKGYYPSARSPERTKIAPDFDTFAVEVLRDIDPLKDRSDSAGGPFSVDQGFYSSFVAINSRLSRFAEMGRELFRAQSLLTNKEFETTYRSRQGKRGLEGLKLYLGNIAGQVGHSRTGVDEVIDAVTKNFALSKVALSPWSAGKQYLHVLTMLADGTVDAGALGQAMREGAAFSKSVRERMLAESGLAYQRYTGNQYLRSMLLLSDQGKLPSSFDAFRQKAMVLQRGADRQVMQLAWRAAELTAKKQGLGGEALRNETRRLFEITAGRDQPTDNPLYASRLEVEAKRQPLLRGALQFAKEQNRIYNVLRRHLVQAAQNPSRANFSKAARALTFGLFGNVAGVVAINQIRREVFDRETSPEVLAGDVVSNLAGLYYLGDSVDAIVQGFIDFKKQATDRISGSPLLSLTTDLAKTAWHTYNALDAGDKEIASGVSRGDSKGEREFTRAFDVGLSAVSEGLGLPFWSLWNQAKGLYVWTDDDYRSMIHFEREKAELKAEGTLSSTRAQQLDRAQKAISEIHHLREKGLVTRDAAQTRVRQVLKQVE